MPPKTSFSTLTFLIISPLFLQADEQDVALRSLIGNHGLQQIQVPATNSAQVALGRSLYFDRELSGNRDVSCATCHHPSQGSGDGRMLSSGVGGVGLGADRTQAADRDIVPRNAPEVFNRGHADWKSMFWDSRVAKEGDTFVSPAKDQLPGGFENPLSVQAMFPVTSAAEMRGNAGDLDIHGQVNELAAIAADNLPAVWNAITARLMAIPGYAQAFQDAYPDVPQDQIGFQHAAQAISAFEIAAFSLNDSAWDRYLAGDDAALSPAAKRGAAHFLGDNCASCHSGNLLTDQQHHNLAVPQLGPGKDASQLDVGRALETGEDADEFAFRTPPLRNVTITGPWMHNGAYGTLEETIQHHYTPEASLKAYDASQLPDHLQSTVKLDDATVAALTANIDAMLPTGETLTADELNDLMAFLASLTSPSTDLMLRIVPESVASGLAVETLPPSEIGLLYDPEVGSLLLTGNEELSLDALFLRIVSDGAGEGAGYEFAQGMAPWADDLDIVLSDEVDAQSFLDYRSNPPSMLSAGDEIMAMLPAGLSASDISEHLIAAYRVHGSATLWTAEVASVPEPSTGWLALLGALYLIGFRKKSNLI